MGANTEIEWADHTFNPWVGCAKVGPGCDHCYAESWAKRTGQPELWEGERRLTKTWGNPVNWDREAREKGIRPRVFCASLADVFDNAIPDAWRADLWALIRATPHLDWIIVTKRIGNAARMLPPDWGTGWSHVWLLATVCTQAEADRDLLKLLATPAAVHGISYEPALGPVDLTGLPIGRWPGDPPGPPDASVLDALSGERWWLRHGAAVASDSVPSLDWVICGGESGPNGRPMHPDWARSMRDQCQAAGAAFFFKQWGSWAPAPGDRGILHKVAEYPACRAVLLDGGSGDLRKEGADGGVAMVRAHKKANGHLLDGRAWLQFPKGQDCG